MNLFILKLILLLGMLRKVISTNQSVPNILQAIKDLKESYEQSETEIYSHAQAVLESFSSSRIQIKYPPLNESPL